MITSIDYVPPVTYISKNKSAPVTTQHNQKVIGAGTCLFDFEHLTATYSNVDSTFWNKIWVSIVHIAYATVPFSAGLFVLVLHITSARANRNTAMKTKKALCWTAT